MDYVILYNFLTSASFNCDGHGYSIANGQHISVVRSMAVLLPHNLWHFIYCIYFIYCISIYFGIVTVEINEGTMDERLILLFCDECS